MDWSGCCLIDAAGVVKGTGVRADALFGEIRPFWEIAGIAERYPEIPADTLETVLTYAVERLAWNTETLVDWSNCPLVERVPGRCSGAPTVVRSRIFPDAIAQYYWGGASVNDIREHYPSLSVETISGLIEYVKLQGARAA